jgi:hypothetical protein
MILFKNCKQEYTSYPPSSSNLPLKPPVAVASDGEPYGGKIQTFYALLSDFKCPDQNGNLLAAPLGTITYQDGHYSLASSNCVNQPVVIDPSELQIEEQDGTPALIYKTKLFQNLKQPPPLDDQNFIFKEVGCIETFNSIYRRKFGQPTIDLSSPDVENGKLVRYDRYDFNVFSNYQGQKYSRVNLRQFTPEIAGAASSSYQAPTSWTQTFLDLTFQTVGLEMNWFSSAFNLFVKFQPLADGSDATIALVQFTTNDTNTVGPLQGVCPVLNRRP